MAVQALLVLDRERLRAQHAQLSRLVVALIANGSRVTSLIPDPPFGDDHPADRRIGLGQPIRYPEIVAPWMRSTRQRELLDAFERKVPDVVWVAGTKAWKIAAALARGLERPLIVQVDGHREARRVRGIRRLTPIAGLVAPTVPIARLLEKDLPSSEVQLVPPGIAIGERDLALRSRREEGPLAIAILGSADARGHYRALFEALAALRETGPGARYILELPPGANQHIWRQLRRFNLTELTTVVSEPARMQRLLAATDLLIRPVPEHRCRPIVLEAMAEGSAVVTVPEPWLDYLGPEQGATIVERPTAAAWREALEPLMTDPDLRQALGTRARDAIIAHHRSSERVEAVEALFIRVVGEESIPLNQDL